MKKNILLILLCFLLFSCSGIEKKVEEEVKKAIQRDYKSELNQYFSTNYLSIVTPEIKSIKLDSFKWVHKFYKKNHRAIVWINDSIQLSENGLRLITQLSNAKKYGLDSVFYTIRTLQNLKKELDTTQLKANAYSAAIELEVLLTHYYMLHGKHLNYGILEVVDSVSILPRKKFNLDLPTYLYKAIQSDSVLQKLVDLQPKHIEYQNLQKGLELFLGKTSLSKEMVKVENFRIDSLRAIKQAKKALVLHQYLSEKDNDSLYFIALTKFQTEHGLRPDSLIGKNTAKALSISPYNYYKQIAANLERWRWREEWPSNYIYINIPSYKMQLYSNTKLVREHKTVVGKFKNQTPEIIDTLEYIIAYPYWNIPRKISVKEILVKVQKDSTYLMRNNYEVLTYTRETIDPATINWNEIDDENFRYLIRQKGGVSNALGLVKFIFPNKYAIYMHDTPSKHLFYNEIRAYSHGCVRVYKAIDLANYILKSDNNKYTIDSIHKYIENRKEKLMLLNTKIPMYIYYFTTSADSLGTITLYNDVYKKDEKLITALVINGN